MHTKGTAYQHTRTMKTLLLQAVLLSLYAALTVQTCNTTVGRRPTTFNNPPQNHSELSGLFLNTKDSLSCDGAVVAWDYCYYQQDQNLTIQAGIWRLNESEWQLVDDSNISLPTPYYDSGIQFICRHWNLKKESFSTVMEGDVVGISISETMHVFEASAMSEGVMKVELEDPEGCLSTIPNCTLKSTSLSLYLEAVVKIDVCEECNSTSTTPMSATTNTDVSENYSVREIVVSVILGSLFLVCLILTIVFVLKFYIRSRASGPVLITRLKKENNQAKRVPKVTALLKRTETEAEVSGNSNQHLESKLPKLQQTFTSVPHPPSIQSSVLTSTESHVVPKGQSITTFATDVSTRQPPVVFTIGVEDEQQLTNEQQLTTSEYQKPSCNNMKFKAQKIPLLPKLDLRRAHSAAEALSFVPSESDRAQLTSSSEYPYVLHSFEVVGNDLALNRSLPNIHEFRQCHTSSSQIDFNSITDISHVQNSSVSDDECEQDYSDVALYANTKGDEPNSIYDEVSYCSDSVGEQVQHPIGDCTLKACQDYHYDEYPSTWTPAAQLTLEIRKATTASNDFESPEYQEIDKLSLPVTTLDPTAQPHIHNLPLKQSLSEQSSGSVVKLKGKPPIKPRKKYNTNMLTVGDHDIQPSEVLTRNSSDTTPSGGAAQSEYMKLLQSTRAEPHEYLCFQSGSNELC